MASKKKKTPLLPWKGVAKFDFTVSTKIVAQNKKFHLMLNYINDLSNRVS